MPIDRSCTPSPAVRAAHAGARAERRLTGAVDDFLLPDEARLDERTRLALGRRLSDTIGALDLGIRRYAARLLDRRDDGAGAERLLAWRGDVLKRIARPGLLPVDLVDELIGQIRHDLLAAALPLSVTVPEEPSLLVRLTSAPDAVVANAATALLAAENRRRSGEQAGHGNDLPAELHHRLVWLVAAALYDATECDANAGQALAEAVQRSIAAHNESERLEAVALRLAVAIDARPEELPELLLLTLGDRQLALFVAVLARSLDIDAAQVRAIVVEPDDERLWLALRAVALSREGIAQIALALADADPRRDIEVLADHLDQVAEISPEAARTALAPLTLPAEFRMALRALGAA